MLVSDLIKELNRILTVYGDYRVVTNAAEEVIEIGFVIVTEDFNGERLVELE